MNKFRHLDKVLSVLLFIKARGQDKYAVVESMESMLESSCGISCRNLCSCGLYHTGIGGRTGCRIDSPAPVGYNCYCKRSLHTFGTTCNGEGRKCRSGERWGCNGCTTYHCCEGNCWGYDGLN